MYTLNDLPIGCTGEICSLTSFGKERRRMLDLGLTAGTNVSAVFRSPFGDPVAYQIRGTIIAIRNEDAMKITIK